MGGRLRQVKCSYVCPSLLISVCWKSVQVTSELRKSIDRENRPQHSFVSYYCMYVCTYLYIRTNVATFVHTHLRTYVRMYLCVTRRSGLLLSQYLLTAFTDILYGTSIHHHLHTYVHMFVHYVHMYVQTGVHTYVSIFT